MNVNDVKNLLSIMKNIDFSRTEFLIDFNDYIKDNDLSKETLHDWLFDTNQLACNLANVTEKLYKQLLDEMYKNKE